MKILLILLLTFFINTLGSIQSVDGVKTYFLTPGDQIHQKPATYTQLHIFCYKGRPKYLFHIWQSIILHVEHPDGNYIKFDGATPEDVTGAHETNNFNWAYSLFTWKEKQLKLDPFNQSCVGIETKHAFFVTLNLIRLDYWKLILCTAGVLVFLLADKFSRNQLFYYLCGVSIGVSCSFLVLIYFISKLFPRRPLMYGIAACGWSIGVYLVQLIWDNIRLLVLHYKIFIVAYVVATSLISLIVCYRYGPVENKKTKNLIRWTLQACGLIAIFLSTHFQEAAMGQIIILLLFSVTPASSWFGKSKTYWKRRFPPKTRLLTNEEYYQQAAVETEKALNELRGFCSSPECKQWQMAMRLKNVKRFASFVEGNSHLIDDEVLEYETSMHSTNITEDEEDDDY